jgi:hypothetical protein
VPNGDGVFTFKNGDTVKTTFTNWQPGTQIIYTWADGDRFEGSRKNGGLGSGWFYPKSGEKFEVTS